MARTFLLPLLLVAFSLPLAADEDPSEPYASDPSLELQDQCALRTRILAAQEGSDERLHLESLWHALWPETPLPESSGGEVYLCDEMFSAPPPGESLHVPAIVEQYCGQLCGGMASRLQEACARRGFSGNVDCGGVGYIFLLDCLGACVGFYMWYI
jgi:hypothetical protein